MSESGGTSKLASERRLLSSNYADKFDQFFKHEPLNRSYGAIRVFRVLPGSGLIACELRDVSTASTYSAISYVCGPSNPTEEIHINGQRYAIRRSLNRILERIRHEGNSRDWFWADAISINQTDTEERSFQVGYMGEIFAKAQHVDSWISTTDDGHEEFLKLAITLHQRFENFPAPKQNMRPIPAAIKKVQAAIDDKTYIDREHLKMFKDFCRAEYFTRVWICQEVLLPTGSHLARCGSTSMRWMDLRSVLLTLNNGLPWNAMGSVRNSGARELFIALDMDSDERSPVVGPSRLESLIKRFRRFQCYDPRDHIYALAWLWDSNNSPIQPDYAKSCAALFWDLMIYLKPDENLLQDLLRVSVQELREAWPLGGSSQSFVLNEGSTDRIWSDDHLLSFTKFDVATYELQFPTRQVRVYFCCCTGCARTYASRVSDHRITFAGLSDGRLMVQVSIYDDDESSPRVMIGFASASRTRTAMVGGNLEYCVVLPLELNGDVAHMSFSQGIEADAIGLMAYMDVRDFQNALDSGNSLNGHSFPTAGKP